MSDFTRFIPFAKVDAAQQMVWGYASTPTCDLDGEIIELQAIKDALPDYMEWGNIREMHQPSAVGVTKTANVDDNGLWIGAKIKDPIAWSKCEGPDPVYKGFSIGGIVKKQVKNVIKELTLVEISLVDRPANPDCRIEMVKGAKLVQNSEATLLPVQPAEDPEQKFVDKVVKAIAAIFKKGDGLSSPNGEQKPSEDPNNPFESQTIDKAKDGEKPYGDVDYADPGYQKDKQKRYPVDTEEHVRAAWSYINMPKNAEHYSEEDLTKVKDKIIAAWKEKIDKDGPPSAAAKSAENNTLQKGMNAVIEGSVAFQSLRRMQRYLLEESVVENDPVDADRSSAAAVLAAKLAALIGQIANDEGGEALTMTDIDDILNPFSQPIAIGEVYMSASQTDLQKRATERRSHLAKAAGHIAKAITCKAAGDQHLNALHEMCKGFAMKAAAKEKNEFDHEKALEHCIAAKSAGYEVDDHHEMAAHHLEKAAVGSREDGAGVGTGDPTAANGGTDGGGSVIDQSKLTEGGVPEYDPTKPYAGKSAMDNLVHKAQEAAYWRGKAEALERMPASSNGPRPVNYDFAKGMVPDQTAQQKLMEGVQLSEDPDVRQKSAARLIGNMITQGVGKNPIFDSSFRGNS